MFTAATVVTTMFTHLCRLGHFVSALFLGAIAAARRTFANTLLHVSGVCIRRCRFLHVLFSVGHNLRIILRSLRLFLLNSRHL
ncbi:MAG: hypothetical protein IJ343_07375, partial [Clostridia bacterium]|nr:hypothetical protein [Clostridia bacterium]